MGGRKRKKKEPSDPEKAADDTSVSGESTNNTDGHIEESARDKYETFRMAGYSRQYPEDGAGSISEYLVIIESEDPLRPIGERDMMSLGNSIKSNNKGVKRFKRINKYKIGAIFERPGLANLAVNNKTFLKDLKIKATIPAAFTEVTGVIKNVPKYMSNKDIYKAISSSKDIVSVRRFMRRAKQDEGPNEYIPTPSVSITFACPTLPDTVDINSWLFEVSPYIPPVTQCLRCLRYDHIGKYCKNAQRCSICGEDHSYKTCVKEPKDATCVNCNGNHLAISGDCPLKKKKIQDNKNKTEKAPFASLFDQKSFPPLKSNNNPKSDIENLLKSPEFMNLLVQSIVKIVTSQSQSKENICSKNIKSILIETFSNKTKTQTK